MLALFGSNDFQKSAIVVLLMKSTRSLSIFTSTPLPSGAKYVMPFRVNTSGQGTSPRYFLIHASKDIRALRDMKNNMAKVSDAHYRFGGHWIISGQMSLFEILKGLP